jgi:putative two-component system response regulator
MVRSNTGQNKEMEVIAVKKNRSTIILVDDNSTNLVVGRNALSENYDTITLGSCAALFETLEIVTPDLILLDVKMPDMDGYDGIKLLKKNPVTAAIPVIFLTARTDADSELEGLNMGAVDYIHKPFSPALLLKRIELHLMLESQKIEIKELTEDLHTIIDARTKDMLELNRVARQLLKDVTTGLNSITVEQIELMRDYMAGEVEKLVNEGGPLCFVPKPVAVFGEREHEYRIMLQKILEK